MWHAGYKVLVRGYSETWFLCHSRYDSKGVRKKRDTGTFSRIDEAMTHQSTGGHCGVKTYSAARRFMTLATVNNIVMKMMYEI